MIFTEAQLHQVAQIIQDHHTAFIANVISPDLIQKHVLEQLKAKGLVNVQVNSIEQAYLYGQALAQLETANAANMSFDQFQKWLVKNPIPLTQTEKQAIAMAQANAGIYCKGLGNKVDQQTGATLIEADQQLRHQIENTIKTATAENIARRETLEQLKSDLGHATQDWARDWKRIANTEKHTAMLTGQAAGLKKKYGSEVTVFKRPAPSACQHCNRLHTGPDGMPLLFKLSDLEANGVNNVGRKAAEWLAVIGATHPHCQCQMSRMPPGWGFNEEGDMEPGGEFGEFFQKADKQYDIAHAKMVTYQGLRIQIENPAGSERQWGDEPHESTRMLYDYGFVIGSQGNDEDEIDVYVGPDPKAPMVYGMHQQNPHTGIYDEDKWMLGFETEQLATAAYQAHYNRHDFVVSVTTMPIEHFKRICEATQVNEGEMTKGQRRYTIPIPESAVPETAFQKAEIASSGRLHTVAGAVSGKAHKRAVDRGSTGPNLLFNVPAMPRQSAQPADGWQPDDLVHDANEAQKQIEQNSKPKEVYYLPEQPINVRPIEPERLHAFISPETEEQVRANQQWLQNQFDQSLGHNTDPRATRYVLSKAGPFIGPKGGKWADAKHTVHWDEKKHGHKPQSTQGSVPKWASAIAQQLGGKIKPHKTDANKVMVKVPLQAASTLAKEAQARGLGAEVIHGGNYAMVAVTKHHGGKEPHPKQHHEPKKTEPELSKDMPTVEPDSLSAPRSGQAWYQAGDPVTATVNGQKLKGHLIGFTHDHHGVVATTAKMKDIGWVRKPSSSRTERAVVQVGGERHIVKWKNIGPAKGEEEARPYVEAYRNVPAKAVLYRASDEQQKIVAEVMQNVVVHKGKEGLTAQDYLASLVGSGHEVYMNGGIVRDLIQGTHHGMDHEKLKDKMKDIDISVTASPLQAYHVHHGLMGGDLNETQKTLKYNGGEWGTMLIGGAKEHGGGIGLDIKTFSSNTFDLEGKKGTAAMLPMDHDIEKDIESRDFTVNAMYYDLHNNVVVDTTGRGMQDAQDSTLHIADFVSARKNRSIGMRYFKFRMRNWKGSKDTINWLKKNLPKQWEKDGPKSVSSNIGKNIAKENPNETPTEALKRFRDKMVEDGVGHVFDKYVTPQVRSMILGTVKSNRNKIFGHGNWKDDE